jgi:formylglycine-generating enzyme required for sulfatase activity
MSAALSASMLSCATGLKPPEPTAMAKVTTGLTYRFGMGQDGCDIPSRQVCQANRAEKFDPGNPSVLVSLNAFEIDVHEVTNDQYRYCVAMGACSLNAGDNTTNIPDYYAKPVEGGTVPNPKYAEHPIVLVNQIQAQEYCTFLGRRLPTEFEWERVAGGPAQDHASKQLYPFGDPGPQSSAPTCTQHNVNIYGCRLDERPARVGSSNADVVEVDGGKVWDLFGNVYEWTSSPRNDFVACDMQGQAYECASCVDCLAINPRLKCKPQCKTCACGDGPVDTKPNCYQPCETPVCPKYKAEAQPIDPSKIIAEPSDQLVIRGGSFAKGSAQKNIAPCEGRSDHRAFSRSKGDPHVALGLRCARSL